MDLRSFEIRFEFESDDSYSIRFEIFESAARPHLPSYHKPRSLFNKKLKKNFNRCAIVIEINFMFMILCLCSIIVIIIIKLYTTKQEKFNLKIRATFQPCKYRPRWTNFFLLIW